MILKIDKNKKIPVYLQIKKEIERLIEKGVFGPNTKIPPTRVVAKANSISRNSVIQAYSLLAAEGLVYSETGRGTFVHPAAALKFSKNSYINTQKKSNQSVNGMLSVFWKRYEASLTQGIETQVAQTTFKTRIKNLTNQASSTDEPVNLTDQATLTEESRLIDFDSPAMDEKFLPLNNFKKCISLAFSKYRASLFSYNFPEGFEPLREVISSRMALKGLTNINKENILITSGIQQALSLIGRLFVDPGDIVILESYTYPGALDVFKSLQAYCIGIPVEKDGIDITYLERVLKRRKIKILYTIPTYHNPLGIVFSKEKRQELVTLAEKYGFIIVEDDYARDLGFSGHEPAPIKFFDTSESVIYMGSFSETIFPGIRLSWTVAPVNIIKKLSLLKRASDLFTNTVMQGATVEYLLNGYFDRHIKKIKKELKIKNQNLINAMRRHLSRRIKWIPSTGGVYQWVELPHTIDSYELLAKSIKHGVRFTPDRIFAVEDRERGGFRLNFSNLDTDMIWRGIEIIGRTIEELLN